MKLTVKKQGNSLTAILPEEIAARLNIDDGDTLYLTKTAHGYEITSFDPEFERTVDVARQGIQKYRNALIDLAQ